MFCIFHAFISQQAGGGVYHPLQASAVFGVVRCLCGRDAGVFLPGRLKGAASGLKNRFSSCASPLRASGVFAFQVAFEPGEACVVLVNGSEDTVWRRRFFSQSSVSPVYPAKQADALSADSNVLE